MLKAKHLVASVLLATMPMPCIAETPDVMVPIISHLLFDSSPVHVSDTTPPVIALNGAATVTINLGETYSENGATAFDLVDGNVQVSTSGTVNINKAGSYTITYTAQDKAGNSATLSRVVIVQNNTPSQNAPVITLKGDSEITIIQYFRYFEPGYTAIDAEDGEVDVIVSGTVDRTITGRYPLTYIATDSDGHTTTASRVVIVRKKKIYPKYPDGIDGYIEHVEVEGSDGRIYRCKPWPYSGWCSQPAYAPGEEYQENYEIWQNAWVVVENPDPDAPPADLPPHKPGIASAKYDYSTSDIKITWNQLSGNTEKVDILIDGINLKTIIGNLSTSTTISGNFSEGRQYNIVINAINSTQEVASDTYTLTVKTTVDMGKFLYNSNCKVCHGTKSNSIRGFDLTKWTGNSFASFRHASSNIPATHTKSVDDTDLDLIGIYIRDVLKPLVDNGSTGGNTIDVNSALLRGYRLLNSEEYVATLNSLFDIKSSSNRMDRLSVDAQSIPLDNLVNGFNSDRNMNRIGEDKVTFFDEVAFAYEKYIDSLQNGTGDRCLINGFDFCAANKDTFLNTFATKVFRRPLTTQEYDAYSNVTSIGKIVGDMLSSPHFLYRSEMGTRVGTSDIYELNQYEIATSIAYSLSGTTPNDTLLELAKNGRLSDPNIRVAQAAKLFRTEAGQNRVGDFVSRWLLSDQLYSLSDKNLQKFPNYSRAVQTAQSEQLVEFFKMVVNDPDNSTYHDLFVNNKWITNKVLSDYYGENTSSSDDFEIIPATSRRYGIFTLGAITSKYANSQESHLFKRGAFVLTRLMCHPVGLPTNDGHNSGIDETPGLNQRDRYLIHSADPTCAKCHIKIDPIGISWENYDATGRYRTEQWHAVQDGGPKAIDTTSILKGLLTFDKTEEMSISDVDDVAEIVSNSDRGPRCMATQYFRYIYGDSIASVDEDAISKLHDDFKEENYDLQTLLVNIVGLNAFVTRQGR